MLSWDFWESHQNKYPAEHLQKSICETFSLTLPDAMIKTIRMKNLFILDW